MILGRAGALGPKARGKWAGTGRRPWWQMELSLGYWLASQCEVITAAPVSLSGCIGTAVYGMDYTGAMKLAGIKPIRESLYGLTFADEKKRTRWIEDMRRHGGRAN